MFHIQVHGTLRMGTAFTLDCSGTQYLVTAEHVLRGASRPRVALDHHRLGHVIRDLELLPVPSHADLAVARLQEPIELRPDLPLEVSTDGMIVGQDIYLLGFPLGLGVPVGEGHDLPLVKGGVFAGLSKKHGILYLDCHVNDGMSGGPVVFHPMDHHKEVLQLAGVISRYEPEILSLKEGNRELSAEGANSGIAIATDASLIRTAMDAGP